MSHMAAIQTLLKENNLEALLLTEGLVQNAMEDEHNLSLQLQRVQHEVQEYLQE